MFFQKIDPNIRKNGSNVYFFWVYWWVGIDSKEFSDLGGYFHMISPFLTALVPNLAHFCGTKEGKIRNPENSENVAKKPRPKN